MRSKFGLFLTISLVIAAFGAGYLAIQEGVFGGTAPKTGTLLDKFDGQKATEEEHFSEKIEPLTERQISAPARSSNKDAILYSDRVTGEIIEMNIKDKTEKIISAKVPSDSISLKWSPLRTALIYSSSTDNGTRFKYLNIGTSEEMVLDPNITSVAFSSDGTMIAYYYLNTDTDSEQVGKIAISQLNGSYRKKIVDTRLRDIEISWPITDKLAFKTNGSELFLLTEDGKLTKLLGGAVDLEEKWSPSGKKFIFSTIFTGQDRPQPMLWIKNIDTKEESDLGLSGKASKCYWSIDDIHVFCAISKSSLVDELYEINTDNRSKKLIAEPYTLVRELLLSAVEDDLIYLNASDNRLYKIKIP